MLPRFIQKIIWFISLLLLQVLVLNQIHLGGFATPFLYIYFVCNCETEINKNALLLWSFSLGLLIDIFSDTPGINAASTTFLAMIRPVFVSILIPRDLQDLGTPSLRTMGVTPYLKYISACTIFVITCIISLEYFNFINIGMILAKILLSSILTILIMLSIEAVRSN